LSTLFLKKHVFFTKVLLRMKFLRLAVLSALTIALLVGAIYWSRTPVGYTTPAECVDSYAAAARRADAAGLLKCLGEPLRSELQRQGAELAGMAGNLQKEMKDVKSWVQCLEQLTDESNAVIDVDEVRASGTHRIRFHLERTSRGWLITAIDPPRDVPQTIPYGVHVRDASPD